MASHAISETYFFGTVSNNQLHIGAGESSSLLQHRRNKDGNTPSGGLGRRGEEANIAGEVSPESERGSVSERASTSNGEFCLLTDGRRTTERRGKGRLGEKGAAASLRSTWQHGRERRGRAERRRDKSNRDWSESRRRSCLPDWLRSLPACLVRCSMLNAKEAFDIASSSPLHSSPACVSRHCSRTLHFVQILKWLS